MAAFRDLIKSWLLVPHSQFYSFALIHFHIVPTLLHCDCRLPQTCYLFSADLLFSTKSFKRVLEMSLIELWLGNNQAGTNDFSQVCYSDWSGQIICFSNTTWIRRNRGIVFTTGQDADTRRMVGYFNYYQTLNYLTYFPLTYSKTY